MTKKPFREKYWFLIAIIAYILGMLTPGFHHFIKQRTESVKAQDSTSMAVDSMDKQ